MAPLKYALAGVMRAGASRANWTTAQPFVSIDGVQYATNRATDSERVMAETLTIVEAHDATPNTATFRVKGFQPSTGQEVIITLGSQNNLDRRFAGVVLSEGLGYVGTAANDETEVSCIDYTWHLTRQKVSGRHTSTSATTIALAIMDGISGFTTNNVEAGLPTLDEFTYTNVTRIEALTRLAKRIGGYVKVDYLKDVHLRITDSSDTNPTTLVDSPNDSHTDVKIALDLSQVVTRALVEGGGVPALTTIAPGETIIPVGDTSWFNRNGGTLACGQQRLTYTGLQDGTGGAIVGPSAQPSAALTAAAATGPGIDAGDHYWAYTFATGAGESLPSPVSGTLTMRTVSAPPAPDSATSLGFGVGPSAGVSVSYTLTSSVDAARANETAQGASRFTTGDDHTVGVRWTFTSDMVGCYLHLYRSDNGGGANLMHSEGPVVAAQIGLQSGYSDTATGVAGAGSISTGAVIGQASLTGIAIGPSGTTSRKIYRTAAGGSQLKLQSTIANNTATTLTDSTADSGLGANVPAVDTSGLSTTSGTVNSGSTSLLLAGSSDFSAGGGWAVVGQQYIRYTGISGNTLTGIPATGAGAIEASISYGSTATVVPCLTGIPASGDGAVIYTITPNTDAQVNLLVVVDDAAAQATVAAMIGGGDDGVIEEYLQDGTISETEATARAVALLALRSQIATTVSFTTRDLNARGGRTQAVNITAPVTVNDSFRIQHVTLSNFWPALWPTATVEASAERFSFEDLLRLARNAKDR